MSFVSASTLQLSMSPTTAAGKENGNVISIPRKALPTETLSLLSNTTIERCVLWDLASRRNAPRCIHHDNGYCSRGPSCKYRHEAKVYSCHTPGFASSSSQISIPSLGSPIPSVGYPAFVPDVISIAPELPSQTNIASPMEIKQISGLSWLREPFADRKQYL